MTRTVALVRHPPVALAWRGRCYGQSDPGLSREGRCQIGAIVDTLIDLVPDIIVHSGMIRTRAVADQIAATTAPPTVDPWWRERDFGTWEGRSWNAIYRESGSAMDAMLTRPDDFRPGGGETTAELVASSHAAWDRLPQAGTVVVVTHGGPIAAILALRAGAPRHEIARFIPTTGSVTLIVD